jgi:hypothetical protein
MKQKGTSWSFYLKTLFGFGLWSTLKKLHNSQCAQLLAKKSRQHGQWTMTRQ